MKKVLILLVAVSPLFFSCNNDDNAADNSSNNQQSMLLGKWEVKSFTEEYFVNGQPYNGAEGEISVEDVIGTVFEFKAGNVFSITTYDSDFSTWETETGTYVYNPNQNTIDYTFVESDGTSYTERMNVTSLTQNNFQFNMSEEYSEGGFTFKFKLNINCDRKN